MHLTTHICAGTCIGSLTALHVKGLGHKSKGIVVLLFMIGSALPDIDAISVLFSHKIFYANHWFSHRGAMHSVFGLIISSALVAVCYAIAIHQKSQLNSLQRFWMAFTLIFIGGGLHLLSDLPTPSTPWGGLMLFWPFSSVRVGGFGNIWWVNEYLMLLFSTAAFVCLVSIYVLEKDSRAIKSCKAIVMITNLFAFFLVSHFILTSKYIDPSQWANHQVALMGEPVYEFVKEINDLQSFLWE